MTTLIGSDEGSEGEIRTEGQELSNNEDTDSNITDRGKLRVLRFCLLIERRMIKVPNSINMGRKLLRKISELYVSTTLILLSSSAVLARQ